MAARLQFDLNLGPAKNRRASGGQGPMRLLVMGDFSGRPAAERPPLATRPTHKVDIDNLDTVINRLAPRLHLAGGTVEFGQLDDFHPDSLYMRLELFQALRQARANPPQGNDSLLGQLLGGTPAVAVPAPAATPAAGIDAFIRGIVAPHIVKDTSAQTQPHVAAVDAATTEQMRRLLHDPAFQSLESAWRGVQWLIASLELDENLQLHVFDVTRDELLADVVAAQGQLAQTGLYRALADRWRNVPGGESWSAVCGLYTFEPSDADIGLLAALGLIASQAGGPLLAAGDPALAGDDAAVLAGWQALRGSEAAPWIGLAAPRVLLRLPYGKASDPISAFTFEEFGGAPVHSEYLWGNGGLACALLIGRTFSTRGWDFEPGDEREIGELPAYTYLQDGERELQACAEHYLGEQGGNTLLQAGLMPVMSHRHANAVTVMRFQSVAAPAAPLAGLAPAG
jgi:type VI secretion system protein ImpC